VENTGSIYAGKNADNGTSQARTRRQSAFPESSVFDQLAEPSPNQADAEANDARANGSVPVGNGGDQPYVDKKRLAHRYGISERKVDYLRERGVIPWHLIPPRSVRFKVAECDQALERYRRGGGGS
jgi:hypothetical protein